MKSVMKKEKVPKIEESINENRISTSRNAF